MPKQKRPCNTQPGAHRPPGAAHTDRAQEVDTHLPRALRERRAGRLTGESAFPSGTTQWDAHHNAARAPKVGATVPGYFFNGVQGLYGARARAPPLDLGNATAPRGRCHFWKDARPRLFNNRSTTFNKGSTNPLAPVS